MNNTRPRLVCTDRLYTHKVHASLRQLSCGASVSLPATQASAAAVPELAAAAAGAEGVLDRYLDAWLDKSDALCTSKARKLTALALCTLLSMGAPQVHDSTHPSLSPPCPHATSTLRWTPSTSVFPRLFDGTCSLFLF